MRDAIGRDLTELDEYFIFKCQKGLAQRGLDNYAEYQSRLDFEIKTILKMGFPGYFLIVQDFINWAKRNDIYVGPGRGSAAGSLASYCLGITNLDPIRWNLLFERFLNPDRISMPDIDVDFENRQRDRVIQYVADKYGTDRVAHIGTFGKMKAKSAVRNVAKTLGYEYQVGDEIARLLLAPVHGKPQPLKESIARIEKLHKYRNSNSTQGKILEWSEKVEGLTQNAGVHACGVVIANESLYETVPLFLGKGKEPTTQWEMNNIEEAGYIKFDFLGLEALDKMHTCIDIVKKRRGIEIDPDEIPLDDDETFANLRAGDSVGVFQLEASAGMRDLLVQIRPTHLEDLIALVAIYRPGPLGSDYKEIYLNVRAGSREPEYLVPELEPILSRTSGWLIYQEQIMEICKQLCGYTGGEADEMRKAVGKKKQKLMDKHEPKFKEGWIKSGLSEDSANQMWKDIVDFASYGFNRSHAAAYGLITYQTAYLKTHYPTEYLCAVMLCVGKKKKDHLIRCLTDCRRLGIKVMPPDINESEENFSVSEDKVIRFGLGPIKNVGAAAEIILEERDKYGPFKSMRDFCERVNLGQVNRKKLESLIKSGAFDTFGHNRNTMLHMVEDIWAYREEVKKYDSKMKTFEKKSEACRVRLLDIEEGKLSPKGAKLKPLKEPTRPVRPQWPEVLEFDELSDQEIHNWEHELLGLFVTSHPLNKFNQSDLSDRLNTIEDITEMPDETFVSFAAVVTGLKEITTKKKQQMAFAQIEDLTGSIEMTVFPRAFRECKQYLQDPRPLKIDGFVDAVEADEGDRTTKVKVKSISLLDVESLPQEAEKIEVTFPIARERDFVSLLDKYSGNLHQVRAKAELSDGTKMVIPTLLSIGNHKGAFMRELTRLYTYEGQTD